MRRIALRILAIAIVVLMLIITIQGALAQQFEPIEHHIVSPGDMIEGQIVISGVSEDISLEAEGDFLRISDQDRRGDLLIADYVIEVPQDAHVDRYTALFTAGNLTAETTIDVQGEAFMEFYNLIHQDGFGTAVIVLIFLSAIIFLSVTYFKKVRRSMRKKSYVYIIILISLIIGFLILYTQTNLIVKQSGSSFRQSIDIQGDTDGVASLRISRNNLTPETADWVTFNHTGETILWLSLKQGQKREVIVDIDLPIVDSGYYRYDVEIEYFGETSVETVQKGFRVQ